VIQGELTDESGHTMLQDEHFSPSYTDHKYQHCTDYFSSLAHYLSSKTKLALLLDFDGTLSPLVSRPEDAVLPATTKHLLERLSKSQYVSLAIISGREVDNVGDKVNIPGVTYAGSHGLNIIFTDKTRYDHIVPDDIFATSQKLVKTIENCCVTDGATIEDKGAVFTFHYRNVPLHKQPQLIQQVERLINEAGFKVGRAHAAIESKPPLYWDKGKACKLIMDKLYGSDWQSSVGCIYVGDDVTDEDAMLALKGVGFSFKVTGGGTQTPTNADARLESIESVTSLLQWIEKHVTTLEDQI